ncbi:MAG: hypothetical protein AB1716_21660 [Planctomycetota bacterium]
MSWPLRRATLRRVDEAFGPPLTPEELTTNLSLLERKLNREMKCTAGRNQVYIRSLLTGTSTTPPRVALKCHMRRDIGLPAEVFYEHIRDVCCNDPDACPAWRAFMKRHVPT